MRKPAFKLDAIRHGGKRENASARREEVTRVIIGMEADEVRVEHAEKDFAADRQDPEKSEVERASNAVCHAKTDL